MKSYRLARFIVFCSILALAGCQSPNNGAATHNSKTLPMPIASQLPEVSIDNLNRYDWQLVQWVDSQGKVAKIAAKPPFMMDVRPDSLIFSYNCQRYDLAHDSYQLSGYSSSGVTNITPDSCPTKNSSNDFDIAIHLKRLFPQYSSSKFNFEWLSPRPPSLFKKISGQGSTQRLAIHVNGSQLIFNGTPKPIKPTSGLPITYDLLERYQWRLQSAADANNQTITELSYKDLPITADFYTLLNHGSHQASFDSGCNGTGGDYILTPNHELLIGSAPQTLMGCSPKREAAEGKIRALEQSSKSQLTLSKTASTTNNSEDKPTYQLTQKLESGETLIWQNAEKPKG